MVSEQHRDTFILKVLSGVQLGAEVALLPGEYLLGSGDEDDVQFVDVSVKVGHARLRIDPQALAMRAEAGVVTLNEGSQQIAKTEWREIQPLDIIRIGAIAIAIGPPHAQWSTVTEEIAPRAAAQDSAATPPRAAAGRFSAMLVSEPARAMSLPIALSLGLVLLAVWLVVGPHRAASNRIEDARRDFETVREALAKIPFAKEIEARQELDGQIYVSGYVNTAIERRAAAAAIDKTGAPVHLRIEVLEFLRGEIDSLIAEAKVKVSYALSPRGEVTLNGIILSETEENKFVSRVRDGVIGLKKVHSNIRTAKTLLAEIQRLARVSQIDQKIVLRLEQNVVEANGVVSADKIDAWVGFLQAYSKHFGADIGLRSYVELQYDPSVASLQLPQNGAGQPISIGPDPASGGLDMDRLRDGSFKLSDIFARTVGGPGPAGSAEGPRPRAFLPVAPTAAPFGLGVERTSPQNTAGKTNAPAEAGEAFLLAETGGGAQPPGACRPRSPLTPETIAWALDLLDRMSVSPSEKAGALEPAKARVLLEVAFDPAFAARCLLRAKPNAEYIQNSAYLAEVSRNPGFAAVVTREFPSYDASVSGVSVGKRRFLQMKDGAKLFEGAAPGANSRLEAVGELGAVVRTTSGFARALYGNAANWMIRAALSPRETQAGASVTPRADDRPPPYR